MNLVIAIASLLGIVLIHELGHFSVALAVGLRPRSLNVGFGTPLAKVTRRGITYAIRILPLGGYVALPGMTRPSARDVRVLLEPAVHSAPSIAPAALAVRRALEDDDYKTARRLYPELVEAVESAQLSPSERRSAVRALRDVEEGTASDAYWRAPTWKRISVIAAGPAANFLAAFVILFAVFGVNGVPDSNGQPVVSGVEAGLPAADAGLRQGDRIVAVDGKRTVTFTAISGAIRSSRGKPITVTVVRDGRRVTLGPARTTKVGGFWIWGFTSTTPLVRESVGNAARQSGSAMWSAVTSTGSAVGGIFQTSGSQTHLTTAVGISRAEASALNVSVAWFFEIVAFVSLSLGLMNLLPLLPLDGGHILMSLIESVRRRPLGREVYERGSLIGIALILLVLFIAFHDHPGQIFG
jgi:regulator of sigma E protease